MSDPTQPTGTAEANDDWLAPEPAIADTAEGPGDQTRRRLGVRIGLVGAGAVAGALVVATVSHGSSGTSTPAVNSTGGFGQPPAAPAFGQPPGSQSLGGRSQGGHRPDEQHLAGTLTAVGASTVTVRTDAGTATYRVVGTSEIVRDGRVVALSALRVGDPVFVHVYPDGSGSRPVVERLFAGAFGAVPGAGPADNGRGSGTDT